MADETSGQSLRQFLALAFCLGGTGVVIWNAVVVANINDNARITGVWLSVLYPVLLAFLGLLVKDSSLENIPKRLVHGLISYGGRNVKTLLLLSALNAICAGGSWFLGYHSIAAVSCDEKGLIRIGQRVGTEQPCKDDAVSKLWMPWAENVSFRPNSSTSWEQCQSRGGDAFECGGAQRTSGPVSGPHLLVVRSGELEFTRTIYQGLRAALPQATFVERVGPVASTAEAPGDWQRVVTDIAAIPDPEPFDYLIGVGTQASMALHDARSTGKLRSRKGLVFLGVTNPIEAKLVRSLHNRSDTEPIGGVRYGGETSDLVARLFDAFPGPRKVFFFRKGVPQDMAIARDINNLRQDVPDYRGRLDVLELDDWPKLVEFADPNALYFSWYTMDLMLAQRRGYDIVKKRMVVASTGDLVEDERVAMAAIAVNDFEIGKAGADLIQDDWVGRTSLSAHDVTEPRFRLWIDCPLLREKGIDDVRARVHADVAVACQ